MTALGWGYVLQVLLGQQGVDAKSVTGSSDRWVCLATDVWSESSPRSFRIDCQNTRLRLDVPDGFDLRANLPQLITEIPVPAGGRAVSIMSVVRLLLLDDTGPIPEGGWTHIVAGLHRWEDVLALGPVHACFGFVGEEAAGVTQLEALFASLPDSTLEGLSVSTTFLHETDRDPLVVRLPATLRELELRLDAKEVPVRLEGLAACEQLLRLEVPGLDMPSALPSSLRALVVGSVADAAQLVEQCPDLEAFDGVVQAGAERLGELTRLTTLDVEAGLATFPAAWRGLQRLRHLSLGTPYDVMDLQGLEQLQSLESLVLAGHGDWIGLYGGCDPIAQAPVLKTLVLWAIRKVNGLAALHSSPSLSTVVWTRDDGDDESVGYPAGLPKSATNLWAFGRAVATEASLCFRRGVAPTKEQLRRWSHRHEVWLDLVDAEHTGAIAAALWRTPKPTGTDATEDERATLAGALLERATTDDELAEAVLEHVDLDTDLLWDLIEHLAGRAYRRPRVALQLLRCAARYSKDRGREDRVAGVAREWLWFGVPHDEIRIPVGVLARKHGWAKIVDETLGELWAAATTVGGLLELLQARLSEWRAWCDLAGLVDVDLVERLEVSTGGVLPDELEWTQLREIALRAEVTIAVSGDRIDGLNPGERAALATRLRDTSATLRRASADDTGGISVDGIAGRFGWLAERVDVSPDGRWSDVVLERGEPGPPSGADVDPQDLLVSGLVEVPVRAFDPRPIGDVGVWFWSRLRQRADTLDRLVRNGPLRRVVYEDRYLNTPLLARLLYEILAELARTGRVIETTEVEITTCPSKPEKGSGLVQHRWTSETPQMGVLLSLARRVSPRAQVHALEWGQVTHHRHLKLEWANDEVIEIFLDRGLDFLTPNGRVGFDATIDVDQQVRRLLELDFIVRKFSSETKQQRPTLIFVRTGERETGPRETGR